MCSANCTQSIANGSLIMVLWLCTKEYENTEWKRHQSKCCNNRNLISCRLQSMIMQHMKSHDRKLSITSLATMAVMWSIISLFIPPFTDGYIISTSYIKTHASPDSRKDGRKSKVLQKGKSMMQLHCDEFNLFCQQAHLSQA